MTRNTSLIRLAGASLIAAGLWPSSAGAQERPAPVATADCAPRVVVDDDGRFSGPGPYPYSAAYPNRVCLTGRVRVVASLKQADVYVDGFFAGFVNDFDGTLQYLAATPGDHAITLYKEGYRTITRHVVVTSESTATLRLRMDRLAPDQTSELPPAAVVRIDPSRVRHE
jgi:hypothetical protein